MYWSITFQSLLKASFLALSLSSVSSSPLDIPAELLNTAPPSILESRQSSGIGGGGEVPPPNFGSETISYLDQNGRNITFIHFSGVDITVDSAIRFHLTPPLIAALHVDQDYCTSANISSNTTNTKKRDVPDVGPDGSLILLPPDIEHYEIDINECFRSSIFVGLGQALRDGTLQLFPTTEQAKKLAATVINAFSDLLDEIVSYFDNIPALKYLQEIQKVAAGIMAIANQLGISITDIQNGNGNGNGGGGGGGAGGGIQNAWNGEKIQMPGVDWYMYGNNTRLDCPDPKNFEKQHLGCESTACNGDLGIDGISICQSVEYQGCRCIPHAYSAPLQTYDPTFIQAQALEFQTVFEKSDADAELECNGLGTPFFMSRDIAASEAKAFCKGGVIVNLQDSGHNSFEDKVLNFTSRKSFRNVDPLTEDQCNNLLLQIIDNCDGNSPDNPGNYKHGGSISSRGWTLYLTPLKRVDPLCNSVFHARNWVDRDIAIQATVDLCNTPGVLNGAIGTRFQHLANQGKDTAVLVSVLFAGTPSDSTGDVGITIDECKRQMAIPIDSCDGNDPVGNPDNNKYGGHYVTDYGMVINITPQVTPPVFPPNQGGKELDVNGRPVTPQCAVSVPAKVYINTIAAAIKQYCKDGNLLGGLGSMKEEHGSNYVHLGGRALSPSEADAAYQQGSPVCRYHDAWQGKIIAGDCTTALDAMANDGACFNGGGALAHDIVYTYRCVRWTISASSNA